MDFQVRVLSDAACEALVGLLGYGLGQGWYQRRDLNWMANRLAEAFDGASLPRPLAEEVEEIDCDRYEEAPACYLKPLLEEAIRLHLIAADSVVEQDLFDSRLMGLMLPPPSIWEEDFFETLETQGAKATEVFYRRNQASHYIRMDRVAKDLRWVYESPYGPLDITINRSKPEKDPRAIAAARKMVASTYPSCMLCAENEGFAGHLNHPARQNLRLIRLPMQNRQWYFQYSPYVYYNEHAIFLHADHHPMIINRNCFERLLDIVTILPQYFAGSNADLPIVGGSILSHEHFQGGGYRFAMDQAEVEKEVQLPRWPEIQAGWVKWPLSVLRLKTTPEYKDQLVDCAEAILMAWRGYSDENCEILAFSGEEPHNTVTPIARREGETYVLDLVLRNNRTTEEHPLGLFHPHAEWHAIKKENIGLIEVMGLAVLPARLYRTMAELTKLLCENKDLEAVEEQHRPWVERFVWPKWSVLPAEEQTEQQARHLLEEAVGEIFSHVLEDAGVYKRDEAGEAGRERFIASLR